MKLSFLNQKKIDEHVSFKKEHSDTHRLWMIMVATFMIALTTETAFFSWYFLEATKRLDEAPIPELKTNEKKISSITKTIESIESAIKIRLGNIETSSQKSSGMLQ